MELHADHVWTRITGTFPRELFNQVMSYKDPGRFFHGAYKKGHWDGTVSFLHFNRSQKYYYFGTGFLPALCRVLDEANYKYTLYDSRTFSPATPVYNLRPAVNLNHGKWDYQARALDSVLMHGRGVLKIATGGGKTEIGAAAIASVNKRTLWFTHRKGLMYQTHRRLEERLGHKVGLLGDGYRDIQYVTVAMVQTLSSLDDWLAKYLHSIEFVIGDEVHHLQSDQWYDNFGRINAAWRLGLTATPGFHGPGLALQAMTGGIIHEVSMLELIERGVLVIPRIWFAKCTEPLLPKKMDYADVYKDAIVNNPHRNNLICDIAQVFKMENKPTLTAVKRVPHSEMLADMLCQKGIRTEVIRGAVKQSDRDKIMERLKSGELHHVVAVLETVGEGSDYPFIRALINATGSKGGGNKLEDEEAGWQLIQFLGRGIRGYPGKTYCDYVDISDKTHKMVADASHTRVSTLEALGLTPFIRFWSDYQIDDHTILRETKSV